jgi:hypothetical protein
MMIAHNIISDLLGRVIQLEDELTRNGMTLPETTMTEEMLNWLATMDDPKATRTTRRRIRKREATPDMINTVQGLDAALEPALAEIRAMEQPKANDVLSVLLPIWSRIAADLKNDFMGMADLSQISSGIKPAGDILFWCESDDPFASMEGVERTKAGDLQIKLSSPKASGPAKTEATNEAGTAAPGRIGRPAKTVTGGQGNRNAPSLEELRDSPLGAVTLTERDARRSEVQKCESTHDLHKLVGKAEAITVASVYRMRFFARISEMASIPGAEMSAEAQKVILITHKPQPI